MNDVALFYMLKQKVLLKYKEHYPYHNGDIHSFGNREIAQLIDCIEKDGSGRVSEKWVYTHLKRAVNEKLPRRDMLDIFCRWLGYADWDEFAFRHKDSTEEKDEIKTSTKNDRKPKGLYITMGIAAIIVGMVTIFLTEGGDGVAVCLKDRYTQKEISVERVSLYLIENGTRHKLKHDGRCYVMQSAETESLLVAESPYYKPDTLRIAAGLDHAEFDLQPDDYAMMLRAYMNGNSSDWKKRRTQLEEIISEDAMIEEVMFDDIGVEFLNKEEFINKVTMPSEIARTMEVIDIVYMNNKIVSLKYMQKEK